jgi:hypothetical protein
MRYSDTIILKDKVSGKRYYRGTKYPSVPYSNDDIYIITVSGDRLDLLANDYYKDVSDYWIIMVANDIPRDSIFIKPGTQLRIPANIASVKEEYDRLNLI